MRSHGAGADCALLAKGDAKRTRNNAIPVNKRSVHKRVRADHTVTLKKAHIHTRSRGLLAREASQEGTVGVAAYSHTRQRRTVNNTPPPQNIEGAL
jgi:hypothetical protein